MRSDFRIELFGKRLKKRRKEVTYKNKPLTQAVLADLVGVDIKTIQNWEKGKNQSPDSMNVRNVIPLCEHLDCDFEYLFGAIEPPRKAVADVQGSTGLSEKAVNALLDLKHTNIGDGMSTLSQILAHKNFLELLRTVHIHVMDFNHGLFKADADNVHHVANALNCEPSGVKAYMEASSKSLIELLIMRIIEDISVAPYKSKARSKPPSPVKSKPLFNIDP